MRRPLLVANWKMHKSAVEAETFAAALLPLLPRQAGAELAIAPPFTGLAALGRALRGSTVLLAAQNANPAEAGAFTGEVAPAMLAELGCRYVIAGHSERRGLYGESDDFVAAKVCALLAAGLRPIVCVGESLEVRQSGDAAGVVCRQLQSSLAGVPAELAAEIAVAYEPVWAIGTGETATPQAAQQMHAALRGKLRDIFGAAAEAIRIQYGGSVKPGNAAALLAQPDIDGALVGGASLNPESFAALAAESGGAS